jgi:hypothetical protein
MILEKIVKPKRFFDKDSKKDIDVVRNFFKNYSWGVDCCPFILEPPYHSIPDMIKAKVIGKSLGIDEENI